MNNRDYKIFAPNTFHHIYNRGNGKMDIFKDPQDYFNFYKRLKLVLGIGVQTSTAQIGGSGSLRIKSFPNDAFTIIAYCLMPNHFHFLIRQNKEIPVSTFISKLCSSYGKYFNKKYQRVGGLFQDQFKSILVDTDEYLLWLSAYIHQNPIVAGLVKDLKDYPYSSCLEYLGLRNEPTSDNSLILNIMKANNINYHNFLLGAREKIKQRKDLNYLLLD